MSELTTKEERLIQWDAQRTIADHIHKSGLRSYLIENFELARLYGIIRPSDQRANILGCIDEGVHTVGEHQIDKREAGSGILMPFYEAVESFRTANIKAITSHPNCGAAALAFSRLNPRDQARYSSPDAYGKAWAKAVADKLGIPHLVIKKKEMSRPLHYHDAVGAVLDLTNGGINTRSVQGAFPSTFSIQPDYDTAHTLDELALAASIAFGKHGFGADKFTPDQPFLVMILGGMQREIVAWNHLLEGFARRYQGKVALHDYNILPIIRTF